MRWCNIVFVVEKIATNGVFGYWMLIDFDQSSAIDTCIIVWNHPGQGSLLNFASDVEQVLSLITDVFFDQTSEMEEFLFLDGKYASIQDILNSEFKPSLLIHFHNYFIFKFKHFFFQCYVSNSLPAPASSRRKLRNLSKRQQD